MGAGPEFCECGHHRAEHVWHWGPDLAYCVGQWPNVEWQRACGCRKFAAPPTKTAGHTPAPSSATRPGLVATGAGQPREPRQGPHDADVAAPVRTAEGTLPAPDDHARPTQPRCVP